MTDKQIKQEFKQLRDMIFQINQQLSQFNDQLHDKDQADIEYVAMMTDVDIDDAKGVE